MMVNVAHWRGKPYAVEVIAGEDFGVRIRMGHERAEIGSDDPAFLEEIEGAARAARLALEARDVRLSA